MAGPPHGRELKVGTLRGPRARPNSTGDSETEVHHLIQSYFAGTPLGNRVRGNEPQGSTSIKQREGTEKEVCDKIGVTRFIPCKDTNEPLSEILPHHRTDLHTTQERRVPDNGVKAIALHDLGHGQGPVEAAPAFVVGGHRRGEAAFQNGLEPGVVADSLSGGKRGRGPLPGHCRLR